MWAKINPFLVYVSVPVLGGYILPASSPQFHPHPRDKHRGAFWLFFLKIFIFFLFLPKAPPVHSCALFFQLWVFPVMACGTLPQHGLMSGTMSAPRIQTGETLGRCSGARQLNHSATGPAPQINILNIQCASFETHLYSYHIKFLSNFFPHIEDYYMYYSEPPFLK